MMLPKDQICESISEESSVDPEDGITDSIDRHLVIGHPSADTWEEIWRVVFPGDEDVPAPGESDIKEDLLAHANNEGRFSSDRGAC